MGCRESKRERGGKGLGAKKNKGNQPTATPRNGNHYSPLSTSFPPPFSVVVYSHSPAPSFVVTVQEVCILYCALPPPLPTAAKKPLFPPPLPTPSPLDCLLETRLNERREEEKKGGEIFLAAPSPSSKEEEAERRKKALATNTSHLLSVSL